MNSDYLKHLLDSLETRMNVMRRQAGNTDLEPPNYKEMIEAWYVQIKTLILKEPPEYFVDDEGQAIKEGQVIVFNDNGNRIVHRVTSIVNTGAETRYYTKGDANMDNDPGYRVASDIVGLTDIKISFIGYPTLWLREMSDPVN